MSSILKSRARGRVSAAVIASYVLDWIVILALAGIGTVLAYIEPNKRPFSPFDADISFPNRDDTVTVGMLVGIAAGAPALIIFLVSMILVPGPTVSNTIPKSLVWKRKLWEWNSGWLGLGLSCAMAWFVTDGIKNFIGRPRPDMLARCMPDMGNYTQYLVGGYADPNANGILVSANICTSTDSSDVDEAFRSFPSGHSSFSAAGLVYLTLYLAAKFAIHIPYLSPRAYSRDTASYYSAFPSRNDPQTYRARSLSATNGDLYQGRSGNDDAVIAARNEAAAPPLYLLVLALIPTFVAIYICCSRFYDFKHHALDIMVGFSIGLLCAFGSFYYYHLPISRGAGWAWGPRSSHRAFWAGIGVGSYVGGQPKEYEQLGSSHASADVEAGPSRLQPETASVGGRDSPFVRNAY